MLIKPLIRLMLAGAALFAAPAASAQSEAFRAAADVPKAWTDFAAGLRVKSETVLRSDDPAARRLQAALEDLRKANADQPPLRVGVRLWVGTDGRVTRVSFGRVSEEVNADLTALLMGVMPGPPPSGMLQPVHLKLSLDLRKQ